MDIVLGVMLHISSRSVGGALKRAHQLTRAFVSLLSKTYKGKKYFNGVRVRTHTFWPVNYFRNERGENRAQDGHPLSRESIAYCVLRI